MFAALRQLITRAIAPAAPSLEGASLRRPWGAHVQPASPYDWQGSAQHQQLGTVRARARHGYANNAWAKNGCDAWVSNCIGSGITASSAAPDATDRRLIGDAWTRWCERCDADGRLDFAGLQTLGFGEIVTAGEVLIYQTYSPDGELRLKVLPPERLDSSKNSTGNPRIAQGIELDVADRRLAYWILPSDSTFASVRIPAEDILHVFRPAFAGQLRGISWLAPILLALNEEDVLQDALLVAAKTSALFAGFVLDQNNTGPLPFDGHQQGSILEGGLEPGTLKILPSGFDIKFAQPQQVQSAIDLAKLTIRSVSAGLGVPEHLVSNDLSNANYSSLRAGMLEMRRRIEQVQWQCLIPQMLLPIWRRWILTEILTGRLDLPFDAATLAVNWLPSPCEWVDPEKDAKAELLQLQSGLKSRRMAAAERGISIEQLDEEIAADRQREATLGLNFTYTSGAPTNA